jgi:phenylalanyl-tRNA synthetase beta chain
VDLRLFEIGAVYFPPDAQGNWCEEDRLMLLVSGNTQAGWRDHPRPMDFYDLKGAVERVGERVAGQEDRYLIEDALGAVWSYRPVKKTCFADTISFEVDLMGKLIGCAGQINPDILRKFDIKQPVYLAELTISALISCRRPLTQFTPLPVYPAAPRDLALVVDETVKVGQIISEVRSVAGNLAESVGIFDLYQGKPIPPGRKSVGITIVYRSAERSLSGDEIEQAQKKVVAHLKSRFKAELREQ